MDGDEEKPKHPLTGEPYDEETERKRLAPVEESPSQLAIHAFEKFIVESRSEISVPYELRVEPQELFFALSLDFEQYSPAWQEVNRTYMPKVNSNEFNDSDEQYRISLQTTDNTIQAVRLSLRGENLDDLLRAKAESLSIAFGSEEERAREPKDFKNVSIECTSGDTTIYVTYHEGVITHFGLNTKDGGGFDIVQENNNQNVPTFNKLSKKKILKKTNRSVSFLATEEKIDDIVQIRVQRSKHGQIKEELIIPSQISTEAVFWDVVPKALLDNFYDAPTNLDIWKNTNLATFNIRWNRQAA